MARQIQSTARVSSDREIAPAPKVAMLKLAAVAERAAAPETAAPGPAPRGMMSQPASLLANDSVPQKLIRLTGTYNPVTPPESWRRVRRAPDAA